MEKCNHKNTIEFGGYLAGVKRCKDCEMIYDPNLEPHWSYQREEIIMEKRQFDCLKAENARLREALESISGLYNYEDEPSKGYAGNIAREALKDLSNNAHSSKE